MKDRRLDTCESCLGYGKLAGEMSRTTSRALQAALVAFILLSTVACDQASKNWARSTLRQHSIEAAGGHVQLILTENRGAFLSLGSRLSPELRTIFFSGVTALALIGGLIWLFAHDHAVERLASVSLIVGGGFGNLVDRVLRFGAVTDFIFVRCGPLRTGIFNLADVFITTGALALLLAAAFHRRITPKKG